jgi:hypothetical protein
MILKKTHIIKNIVSLDPEKYFTLFLLIVTIISHGILLPALGYYGDDWNIAWLSYKVGSLDVFFQQNRSLIAPLFTFFTKIFNYHPWQWHLYLLIMRWLISLVLFYLLKSIKILDRKAPYWISLLFLIYPGALIFHQPLTFSVIFFQLLLFICSFWLYILSIQSKKSKLALKCMSLFFAFSNLIITEYYYFLELIRPVFLWFFYKEDDSKKRLKKVVLESFPYLLIFILVLLFRVLYPSLIRGPHSPEIIDRLSIDFISAIKDFSVTAIRDSLRFGLLSWMNIFQPQKFIVQQGKVTSFIYLILVITSSVGILFYLSLKKLNKSTTPPIKSGIWLMVIGLFLLLLAGIPFWIAGLEIKLGFYLENRFALPFSFGASFLIAGILLCMPNRYRMNIFLLSMICGLTVGFHFFHSNLFRYDWINQKRLYWQLAWRFPTLPAPTLLVADILTIGIEGENTLSIATNWMYFHEADKDSENQVGYYLYFDEGRLRDEMNGLNLPLPPFHGHLIGSYSYAYYNITTFTYRDGCLRVLDPVLAPLESNLPGYLVKATLLSDLNADYVEDVRHQVIMDPVIFGPEPEHNWCYYFEKADLAKAQGKWFDVIELRNEAMEEGYTPTNPVENIPFIEAYLNLGEMDEALNLSREISLLEDGGQLVCGIWGKYDDQLNYRAGIIAILKQEFGCSIE